MAGSRRKRDRGAVDSLAEEEYVRSKRLLHEGFCSLTLADAKHPLPIDTDEQSACEVEGIERLNSTETVASEDSSQEASTSSDVFFSAFKGGRMQYVRKVDYLVDELIRKTQRTALHRPSEELACIPASVGPHPASDHAISLLAPAPESKFQFKSINAPSSPEGGERPQEPVQKRLLYAGDVTHSDWGIMELAAPTALPVATAVCEEEEEGEEDGSDMACCDSDGEGASLSSDSHEGRRCRGGGQGPGRGIAGIGSSSSSGSAGESDDEPARPMELCSDDKYFTLSLISNSSNSNSNRERCFGFLQLDDHGCEGAVQVS